MALTYSDEMIEYDEDVLRNYASRLYVQSVILMLVWGLAGAAVGFLAQEIILMKSLRSLSNQEALAHSSLVACIIVGLLFGWAKYQELRIKAQTILCQVEIEANTRKTEANTRRLAQPNIEQRRIA